MKSQKKFVVEMKPFWKSKTFWIGFIQILIGVLTYIQNNLQAGASLTASGIIMILLRLITKQPISLKKVK